MPAFARMVGVVLWHACKGEARARGDVRDDLRLAGARLRSSVAAA